MCFCDLLLLFTEETKHTCLNTCDRERQRNSLSTLPDLEHVLQKDEKFAYLRLWNECRCNHSRTALQSADIKNFSLCGPLSTELIVNGLLCFGKELVDLFVRTGICDDQKQAKCK